ncbi:MAG: lysophospholipid acyltransferase family protein [Candidatus Gastranaerophilaceae bacterium]
MVRLINKENMETVSNFAYFLMHIQEFFTYIVEINNPRISPCIYVMWHENQFCVYGLQDKGNVNILISNSIDGEIIARVVEKMGFQTCRGSSQRKGAVSGTLKMISKLKNGEDIAIMVDGPRGPVHKVKSGAIVLAREAKVPIVPVHWYSEDFTFVKFPSWDKMTSPIGPCRLMNLYGEPISVEDKSDEQVAEEIKTSLLHLEEIAPKKYKEAKKLKLWNKRK